MTTRRTLLKSVVGLFALPFVPRLVQADQCDAISVRGDGLLIDGHNRAATTEHGMRTDVLLAGEGEQWQFGALAQEPVWRDSSGNHNDLFQVAKVSGVLDENMKFVCTGMERIPGPDDSEVMRCFKQSDCVLKICQQSGSKPRATRTLVNGEVKLFRYFGSGVEGAWLRDLTADELNRLNNYNDMDKLKLDPHVWSWSRCIGFWFRYPKVYEAKFTR